MDMRQNINIILAQQPVQYWQYVYIYIVCERFKHYNKQQESSTILLTYLSLHSLNMRVKKGAGFAS